MAQPKPATRRRGIATVLVPLGVAFALGGLLSYGVAWREVFASHPRFAAAMREVLRDVLWVAGHVGIGVPVLIVAGSLYRLVASSGSRGLVFLKLTAYVILWGLGSYALFAALYLTYLHTHRDVHHELVVPAALAAVGYIMIGVGLVASVLRRG